MSDPDWAGSTAPRPGFRWYHLILHTKGTWLHGDPRGFRSRHHRIHSSGDYQNPPPPGEHAGLWRHMIGISKGAVEIPPSLLEAVGKAILKKLGSLHFQPAVLCVGATHAHGLVELPDDYVGAKIVSGKIKQASSHALREVLAGQVWAEGGKPVEVNDEEHYWAAFHYILDHVQEGAWVWSFHPENPDNPDLR